jgi:hypothetical protein
MQDEAVETECLSCLSWAPPSAVINESRTFFRKYFFREEAWRPWRLPASRKEEKQEQRDQFRCTPEMRARSALKERQKCLLSIN